MKSMEACEVFFRNNIKADMIFIDSDHKYVSVYNDITNWSKVLKENGILAGHDFYIQDVQRALIDSNISYRNFENLWQQIKPKVEFNEKTKIYDCFTFYNELDLLELRLNELNDVVDKFVIVESEMTHSGNKKKLYYEENKKGLKNLKIKLFISFQISLFHFLDRGKGKINKETIFH